MPLSRLKRAAINHQPVMFDAIEARLLYNEFLALRDQLAAAEKENTNLVYSNLKHIQESSVNTVRAVIAGIGVGSGSEPNEIIDRLAFMGDKNAH